VAEESPLPVESPIPVAEESPLPVESPIPVAEESPLPVESTVVDQDGVPAAVEALAPSGDGDTDGVADAVQPNVVSLPAAVDLDGNGLLDDYVTIESPPGTVLLNVAAVPVPTDPAPPDDIVFPVGLFDYEVVVASPGDSAAVTFHLPDGVVIDPAATAYWVVQNGQWTDLTPNATADPAADELTVALADGGAGDEDRSADGIIADPGGPGVPEDPWTFTISVAAPADLTPEPEFNFFLEECNETAPATTCTPQSPRLWVDPLTNAPTAIPAPAAVSLSHLGSFTWANLDPDRVYRLIEVGTAQPPATGSGSPPAGWEVTGFQCESIGTTLVEAVGNSISGYLEETVAEGETSPAWATCTVVNIHAVSEPRTNSNSTITARKWGDRSSGGTNSPLSGATMGLWRDDGDGEFEPGAGDGNAIQTCVTGAAGTCAFTGLPNGGYWVQEISGTNPAFAVITTWAPGAYDEANPPLPYAAYRYGDPAADGGGENNGYPLFVNGNANSNATTDWFANRRVNPSIGDIQCQQLMRIVLVLDRSGSIQENGPAGYQQAVESFLNDLVGTNTQVAIVSFAASATTDASYTDINTGLAALLAQVENIYENRLGGGTNWDAGLQTVDAFAPNPDLVLMVTDGNPTLNQSSSTSSGEVNWFDFTEAVTSSNRLKAGDSRVIAVAAGAANTISVDGLIGISGPLTNQPSALDDDYFLGTVDELAEELREIAIARCGASVKIKKEIETTPGQWDPGVGWSFDILDEDPPSVNFSPVPPASTVLANGVAEVTFEWASSTPVEVTITELTTPPADDYFDPVIVCWAGPGYEGEGAPLTPTSQTARSVTFTVPTDEDYSCRFRNSPMPVEQLVQKYDDLNANGARDTGEPLIDTWTFWADLDQDGQQDPGEPTATTVGGVATFSLTPTASYRICEVTQSGWINSDPGAGSVSPNAPCKTTDQIVPGGTPAALQFGNYRAATKTGTKLEDPNADGVLSDGVPVPGITINLIQASSGTVVATDVTDGSGVYSFDQVVPGTAYLVCESAISPTWTQSYPANTVCAGVAGMEPGGHAITLNSGELHSGNDFGNWRPATKSGAKFEDLDADGAPREAGEPGVAGWTIYVDYDGNSAMDPGEPSAVTAADGSYTITGIRPGTWNVREMVGAGWTCSFPNAGTEPAPVTSTACLHSETFTSGAAIAGNDFGNWRPATKSGLKFEDLDADGAAREAGEPAVPGLTIHLLTADGSTLLASTTTAADGSYSFGGLAPGSYLVCEGVTTGWTQSFPSGTGCASATGTTVEDAGYAITLTSGENEIGNDFGNWRYATKTGTKLEDQNGNGDLTDGVPVPGIPINLIDAGTGTVVATDVTDGSGVYSFDQVVPGTAYLVCESTVAPTWTQSFPANTACAGIAGMEPGGHAITLVSGQIDTGNDFGNWLPAMIIVEKQTLPNGSSQEFAFDGDAAGSLTDGGQIVVDGLQAGTYTSTETVPAGWDLTSIVCDDEDSTGDITTRTATFQLQPGERVICVFTNTQRGTIIVEKQTNPPGASQAFSFTGTASGSIADNGRITVSDLVPGTYTSTETVPAGWVLASIACDDGTSLTPSSGDVASRTATFRLDPGETVVCIFTNSEARLGIVKSATPGYYAAVGDIITYTVTVTNIGSTTLSGVTVSDPLLPGLTCVPALPATLAPGAAVACSATYTITQADLDRGTVPNSACATSVQTPTPVCDSATVREITVDVLKTADDLTIPAGGQEVTFTFTVTNTSSVPLQILSLQDDVFGTLEGDADCRVGTVLQPGASCAFEATFFVESEGGSTGDPGEELPDHVNTITVCVASPTGSVSAAADQAVVCDTDPETIEFERDSGGAGAGGGDQPRTDMLPMTDSGAMLLLGLDQRWAGIILMLLLSVVVLATGRTVSRQSATTPIRRRHR
jgi:uncharacterized repeat protein (TIGR01451 family)